MQIRSCCLISLKRTPRLQAWRTIIMLWLFSCTAAVFHNSFCCIWRFQGVLYYFLMNLNKSTEKHQSCCWLNNLCQKFPFHHQAFSLLKYENYKIKRIIKNCFLLFKNTKNLVIFRNWQEKNVKKPEAVVQRFRKKGVFGNFANQRCFPVNLQNFQ